MIVAAAFSLLAGASAQRPRRYQFWRSWVRKQFWLFLALYLLAHALLGVLAALLADSAGWRPLDSDWVWNGLIYAAVAESAIRVAPHGFSEDLRGTQTILSRVIEFIIDALNLKSEHAIESALDELSGEGLAAQASYLFMRYVLNDNQIPAGTREVTLKGLEEASDKIADPRTEPEGRGVLENFCLVQFTERQLLPRVIR